MDRLSPGWISVLAVFFFAVSYYSFTAKHLPIGAGPDASANQAAAAFYFHHKSLAVFPEDEGKAHIDYSPYGTTRLLRPPLSFLVSALVAPFSPLGEKNSRMTIGSKAWHIAIRSGSVLFCALTVVLVYIGLYWYFGNVWYAALGSALTGFLPQFTFIASYLNDDSSAIFSATMLFSALVLLFRRRINFYTVSFLGLSIGLVFVSKLSAYIVLPVAGLTTISFLRIQKKRWLPYGLVLVTTTIIGGGWWPLFNMSHYGIDDPFALQVNREVASRHRTLNSDRGHGFISQGIGFSQLIFSNHKDFIGASLKSTIGHLDWLKLRLGPLQYGLYSAVFILALMYYLMRLLFVMVRFWTGTQEATDTRRLLFETLLFVAIVFQIFVYTWRNVYQDIQIQGKYILPIILPVLILFLAAARALAHDLVAWCKSTGRGSIILKSQHLLQVTALLTIVVVGLVHIDGLFRFVFPFYWPPAYSLKTHDFEYLNLEQPSWTRLNEDISVNIKDGAWLINSTGEDPQLVLPSDICGRYGKTFLIQIRLDAKQDGVFQAFIDDGKGFRAGFHAPTDLAKYTTGSQTILLGLSSEECRLLRLDPMLGRGQIKIEAIGFSRLTIRAPRYPTL
ncbi:MAG: hypothetical protein VX249_11595 [Pseudomonadota bacterium]|nr:hypothetical protein [Pseudomonadota bacterium]